MLWLLAGFGALSTSPCLPKSSISPDFYLLIYWFLLQVPLQSYPAELVAVYSAPSLLFCLSEFELHWPGREFSFPCQLIHVPLGDSCGGRFVFIVRLTGSHLVLGGFLCVSILGFHLLVEELEPALLRLIVAPFTALTSIVLKGLLDHHWGVLILFIYLWRISKNWHLKTIKYAL